MTGPEIIEITQKLLTLRAEIMALEESNRETVQPVELEEAGIGGLSRSEAMQAQKKYEEGTRLRKRQLQKIDGALRRIKAGQYGTCFVCEKEIDALRLSADPTITRCADCVEE